MTRRDFVKSSLLLAHLARQRLAAPIVFTISPLLGFRTI